MDQIEQNSSANVDNVSCNWNRHDQGTAGSAPIRLCGPVDDMAWSGGGMKS